MLEERVRVANLLDIYGMLLTEKQRRILARYMLEDYSLGEIAEEEEISRQAVHDSVKRGLHSMEAYEKSLGLMSKEIEQKELFEKIYQFVSSEKPEKRQKGLELLERLINS